MSDYSWGWAPFHYGNWFYDDSYGWMWSPGYEWAPAWVTWGESGGNYGWAPIGPNIQIGSSWNTYRPPVYYWTFLPRTYMGSASMTSHYLRYNNNVTIINNITVINNINSGGGRPQYMRGPQASYVERYTHAPVRPVTIRESSRPGRGQVQNGQVTIYRPAINRAPAARPAAPPRVRSLQAVKPTTLPGYNRNVRPAAKPAAGNGNVVPGPAANRQPARPAPPRPAANRQPANHRSSTQPASPQSRPSTPVAKPVQPANREPVRPGQNNHPVPRQTARPVPNQAPAPTQNPNSRPVPQARPAQRPSRAVPQQPRPVPQQQRVVPQQQQQRPVPQQQPRPAPQQQARPESQQPRPVPQQEPRPVPQEAPRPAPAQPAERSPR
jgi:hypothetical protein